MGALGAKEVGAGGESCGFNGLGDVEDVVALGDGEGLGVDVAADEAVVDLGWRDRVVEAVLAGLGSRDAFLAAARQHTELIAEWAEPGAPPPASLEGFLFPDTYRFSRHATPVQMLTAMVHRFRQSALQLNLNQDVTRTVIMASLIEKEVSQESERPLVASVFVNRLAQGMPLATDPTVIYAALLEDRWRGTIYASDLQSPSPYNTYKHTGLPPGPIANPGIAALKAAISPAKTDYLYFVSDAAGHSRFSTSLKEHTEQVQAYRHAQKTQLQ